MTQIHIQEIGLGFGFKDLVDIESFRTLMEKFFQVSGVANGVVGNDGELITQCGWTEACRIFHRTHPVSNLDCLQSNHELMHEGREGSTSCAICVNGLLDYATPIVIEGHKVATLFMGQVLHEAPDEEFFRQRAIKLGFDQEEYLQAIRQIPVIDREKLEPMLECMAEMAKMLATQGLSRLRQIALEHNLNQVTERRIQLEDIVEMAPIGVGWATATGQIEYLNHRFTEFFGYTLDDIPDMETWDRLAYPDPTYRREVVDVWHERAKIARSEGTHPPQLEVNIRCKDGGELRVLQHLSWIGDRQLFNFIDITAHWKSELRNRTHDLMLEMVARGEALEGILASIIYNMEIEDPSSMCSVLLLDKSGKHLLTGAAPRLPDFYNEAIDGLEIGKGVGSCGTAAYLGERVIVSNIADHPYWKPYLELTRRANLAACWSEPILASNGQVLGTFAIYHAEPLEPHHEDIERITFAANLAAIAIENRRTREELAEREQTFRALAENAPDIIVRYDLNVRMIYHNPRLVESVGVPSESLIGYQPGELGEMGVFDHYEGKIRNVIATGKESRIELNLPTPNGIKSYSIHMVAERDSCNRIIGVLGIARDITERKQMESELERQAHMDELTNLPNRRYFLERAESELARVHRFGHPLSLVMFDVDHFKRINDTYGHRVGDRVLRRVAETCLTSLRTIDIVGRIGGEEFVVLLPHTGLVQAAEAAERLRVAIAFAQTRLDDGTLVGCTASFGVAAVNSDTHGLDELLSQADSAMYRAKNGGRNRVCITPD